jgi:HlyD family secretion protein
VVSSDAVRIRPGARVFFEHWGGDTPLEGRVRVIEPAGFLKISALGVEEQRVNVIADFLTSPEDRRALGDAYRVEARIVVWESERVLKLPVGALFRSGGEWAVFAVRDGRARLTRVEVGHGNGRETEIRRGLVAGSEVVIHPSDKVADGVAVRVRDRR